MRALDEARIFDDFEKVPPFLPFSPERPLYKGLMAGEGDSFTLPSLSFFWHFSLTFLFMQDM
jgi:hypothetical protein